MLDDLLKQVGDLLRDESDSKDGGKNITVGNVGNNSTVVIVNGSNAPRRRKSDRPGSAKSAQGRRGHDQDLQKSNEALTNQVKCLERLVEHLLLNAGEPVFKRQLRYASPCLTSTGKNPRIPRMSQSRHPRAGRILTPTNSPQSPATPSFTQLPPPNSIYYRLSQSLWPLTSRNEY